jgi:hypothetical protein
LPEWNENKKEHQSVWWLMTWPKYEAGICCDYTDKALGFLTTVVDQNFPA